MGDGSIELRDEFSDLNEGLITLLECPVCRGYMTSSIYACTNQHTVCSSCKSRLGHCPICRAAFLDSKCLFAENVAQNLIFPCENSVFGCNEKYLLRNKAIHDTVCPYRFYHCVLGQDEGCKWQGRYNEIPEHAEEKHNDYIWHRPNGRSQTLKHNFNFPSHLNGVRLIISYSRMFWYNFKCDFEEGKWYSTFLYTNPDKKAGDFTFDFEFLSSKGESVKFKDLIIYEDTTQLDSIYTSGKCVCIDIPFICNYLDDDDVLALAYTIKKKHTRSYITL